MVYLESRAANRFICVERQERDVVTVAGRLGDSGQRRSRTYDSASAAHRALARRVRNYRHRGYRLGKQNPAMIAAIAAQPDDVGRYLVYGDWLLQQQDPRGELISVQARLADAGLADEQRARLIAEQDAIFEQHADALVPRDVQVTRWRHGFAQHAQVASASFELDGMRAVSRVRWLLQHPTACFIERVVVPAAPAFVLSILADLVDKVANRAGHPTPRQLVVMTTRQRGWKREQRALGDGGGGATLDIWVGPLRSELPREIDA